MNLLRGLLSRIVKCYLVFMFCVFCFGSSAILRAQTASIPLKSLPQNSRLAIWGDSITETTLYPRFVEMYLLACAGRKDINVCTFGHSGETLNGLISRQSDLEAFHPTIVSFNYGMNDTQYSPYTEAKGAAFDKTMHAVLAMLAAKGISQRIVAGPYAVDDLFDRDNPDTFFHGADAGGLTAAQAQNVTLRHFRDFGRAAAVETASAFADMHNRMLDAYTRAKKDLGPMYGIGVHPTPNGHLLIAYELLKALTCDGDIGTITVDMHGKAQASAGHTVVSFAHGVVVLDSSRYPFCYQNDSLANPSPGSIASILPYVPFSRDLNRLILKVTDLDAPNAQVTWGFQTKAFSREQLAQGINLAAEFADSPFVGAFARGIEAVGEKQEFENYMIKGTSNYFGNDNGGNFDANMIAVQAQKDAAVKALLIPVRHAIAIVPQGAPEAVPPVFVGALTAFATAGKPFTYQPSTLHSPTHFTTGDLPLGLTFNAATGVITGTPTETGTHTITLTATNGNGSGTATLTLVVDPARPDRPVITNPDAADATVGTAFTYQITATNKPTGYFFTSPSAKGIVPPASSLPTGLTYNTTTGVLSGTPQTAGTYPLQLAAMNASGVTTKLITLTVKAK